MSLADTIIQAILEGKIAGLKLAADNDTVACATEDLENITKVFDGPDLEWLKRRNAFLFEQNRILESQLHWYKSRYEIPQPTTILKGDYDFTGEKTIRNIQYEESYPDQDLRYIDLLTKYKGYLK